MKNHFYQTLMIVFLILSSWTGNTRHTDIASFHCPACANSGIVSCHVCGGYGGDRIGEYCTDYGGCSSGKRLCTTCYQRGCTYSELMWSAGAKVPSPSVLFGRWEANTTDVFHFSNEPPMQTDDVELSGMRSALTVTDGNEYPTSWIIEDNMFKYRIIHELMTYDKYLFKSWSHNKIELLNPEGKVLTLIRI